MLKYTQRLKRAMLRHATMLQCAKCKKGAQMRKYLKMVKCTKKYVMQKKKIKKYCNCIKRRKIIKLCTYAKFFAITKKNPNFIKSAIDR